MMDGATIGRRAAVRTAVIVLGGSFAAAVCPVPARAQTPEPDTMPTPIPTPIPTPQTVYTAYTDPLNRFAFALAEGWMPLRATVPEIIGVWAAPNDTAATLTVIRFPLPPGTTGDAFAGAYLALLRDQPGYRALDARVVSRCGAGRALARLSARGRRGARHPRAASLPRRGKQTAQIVAFPLPCRGRRALRRRGRGDDRVVRAVGIERSNE